LNIPPTSNINCITSNNPEDGTSTGATVAISAAADTFFAGHETPPADKATALEPGAVKEEEMGKPEKGMEVKEESPTSFVAADDPIPLLIASPAPSKDLLCMEDDSEEEGTPSMTNEPALVQSATHKLEDKIQMAAPAEKRSFKPYIEVITSTEAEEIPSKAKQNTHTQNEASNQPDNDIEKGRGKKSVRFSHSNIIHLIESNNVSEQDDQGVDTQWAVPTNKSNSQAAKVDGLVIEDITDVPDRNPSVNEPTSESEDVFKLADVPLVSDETIQRVDAAMAGLKTKPVECLSAEEKVWQVAASGGSTVDEDAVSLDPQTKARVQERLQNANLLDNVSLKF